MRFKSFCKSYTSTARTICTALLAIGSSSIYINAQQTIASSVNAKPSSPQPTTYQQTVYADYSSEARQGRSLSGMSCLSWMTLSMELRGRTEGQTSYNYTPDGDRIYELTRVYGAFEIRPTHFATGYMQFIDAQCPWPADPRGCR